MSAELEASRFHEQEQEGSTAELLALAHAKHLRVGADYWPVWYLGEPFSPKRAKSDRARRAVA